MLQATFVSKRMLPGVQAIANLQEIDLGLQAHQQQSTRFSQCMSAARLEHILELTALRLARSDTVSETCWCSSKALTEQHSYVSLHGWCQPGPLCACMKACNLDHGTAQSRALTHMLPSPNTQVSQERTQA